jgi:hypothetical protein
MRSGGRGGNFVNPARSLCLSGLFNALAGTYSPRFLIGQRLQPPVSLDVCWIGRWCPPRHQFVAPFSAHESVKSQTEAIGSNGDTAAGEHYGWLLPAEVKQRMARISQNLTPGLIVRFRDDATSEGVSEKSGENSIQDQGASEGSTAASGVLQAEEGIDAEVRKIRATSGPCTKAWLFIGNDRLGLPALGTAAAGG